MTGARRLSWDWYEGTIPDNVVVDDTAYVETAFSFRFCRTNEPGGVTIGRGSSTYLGTMFDAGPQARIRLGDFALVHGARIICDAEVVIGDHALISWNVVLMDTYRVPRDRLSRRAMLQQLAGRWPRHLEGDAPAQPIHIGSNVWIGFDACVLPGVTIGDGAVVGARSVVTADVPAYTVVAGNPARAIRTLTAQQEAAHAH